MMSAAMLRRNLSGTGWVGGDGRTKVTLIDEGAEAERNLVTLLRSLVTHDSCEAADCLLRE